jgi:hypothetical protein
MIKVRASQTFFLSTTNTWFLVLKIHLFLPAFCAKRLGNGKMPKPDENSCDLDGNCN